MTLQPKGKENFQSWDRFLDAYYEPIRTALGMLPYIGDDLADDVTQSFFVKLYEQGMLDNPPVSADRLRKWLYVAARHHAIDEWRKSRSRPERLEAFDKDEPADPHGEIAENAAFDADEFYALSVLHMTVNRVHKHLIAEGKSDHWMIFEELVLAPLIPGRVPRTHEELKLMFPGQGPVFFANRLTTVKRLFQRVLPVLVPADPSGRLTPKERIDELLSILRGSDTSWLWLAFLLTPAPLRDEPGGSSRLLAVRPAILDISETMANLEAIHDELRVLLSFWLEMPLRDYIEDIECVGPTVAAAIHNSRPAAVPGPRARSRTCDPVNLKSLIAGTDPRIRAIPAEEMKLLLERLKTFAKRVHGSITRRANQTSVAKTSRRDDSMPVEITRILYDIAGALALSRDGERISGLGDERFRKNLHWDLNQPWIDTRLRPVFFEALKRLDDQSSAQGA